ncbi:XRE family transcriptional regulator [Streptococcus agalactiae]|uniref:XRE family transcriptional regulator n=1 Tax=Streptococcus agalactiae TaxID=1311 RepID=UPI0013749B72|nr:XRE family transcriptional regulator [Streptococcus agalactiae]KAF1103450.1 XRE family transcriptional regulator [Streptococcus agalactiae]HEM9550046.1 helix-turn-helix transcriptional regulator [Streptococcus agalactiae]HEM9551814.1 helix-turn-helix transcriptional regulator [Streptococcus agalactiae]HEM9554008.1 helix-turn-helix transcriptional regulator [Streptococcus agalactiae]HEM9567936.1 helix-turn-helix transcriptional regulator [Streptococcus agalactiae]
MSDIQKISERIRQLRLDNHLEQTEVAEFMGYKSFTTISKWENGKNLPTGGKLVKLAQLFGTTTDYILHGINSESTPLSSSPTPKVLELDRSLKEPRHSDWISYGDKLLEQQNTVENSKDIVVELFSYNYYDHAASAGTGQYLNDVQIETIELPVDYDADFVIPVYGDSMEPDYHSGDYVFVKLSVELVDGDIGVFEYYGDAYIKQLLINAEGAFLHSLNSKYEDIPIDKDSDFRIIGEVVGSYRES